MTMGVRTNQENIWNFVDKSGDCWNWTGSKSPKGYGAISYQGKSWRAHRLIWVFTNGLIPNDLCVMHKCDNPSCVRPDHLHLGTWGDNNKDRSSKGRTAKGDNSGVVLHPERRPRGKQHGSYTHPEQWKRGESHHNTKLTEDNVRKIRQIYDHGIKNSYELASEFNISASTVQRIVKRKAWIHVE